MSEFLKVRPRYSWNSDAQMDHLRPDGKLDHSKSNRKDGGSTKDKPNTPHVKSPFKRGVRGNYTADIINQAMDNKSDNDSASSS